MKFTSYASGSTGNLYSIEDGQTSILIEAGLPYSEMQRLLPKPPTKYAACLISHSHGDHCKRQTVDEMNKRGIEVVYGQSFRPGEIECFGGKKPIGVKAFSVPHDVANFGFMLRSYRDNETCVFLIDCFYSPIVPSFSPTIIAIEANWARDLMQPGDSINDRLFSSHMSIEQCIKTLQAWDLSKTREIWLLHLSDSRSDEARFIADVQAATGVPTFACAAYRRAA
jgi:phosphoribosyl 1,2-cyclic phosphodiesterase